jgi:hypothetical protein
MSTWKPFSQLTMSMGKTANAPIAPATPPAVKLYADSATSNSQLRDVVGNAAATVGSGGDH